MFNRTVLHILRVKEGYPVLRRSVTALPSLRIYSLRRRIAERLSNKYREERVLEIGPELACLEWLMECGCTEVLMSDGTKINTIKEMRKYVPHVLSNPPAILDRVADLVYEKRWKAVPQTYLLKVDASDSAISNEGFKYFRELKRLETLKMNFCDYFGDDALRELALGRPATTLQDVEIVLNPSISDGSVYWLSRLKGLRRAHFYFLPYVSNRQGFLRQLKIALPKCNVTFPEAEVIGYGYEDKK